MVTRVDVGNIIGASGTGNRFQLSLAPLGTFDVVSFRGEEQLSKLFWFDVLALAPATIDLVEASLIGSPVSFTVPVAGGQPRTVQGIVGSIAPDSSTIDRERHAFRVRIVPRFWLLKHRKTSRIFQNMSVPEIVAAVLNQGGITNRFSLTQTYPSRDYCVQYQETDYSFVKRLLGEEGIAWYFAPPDGIAGAAASAIAGAGSALGGSIGGAISDAEAALGLVETVVFFDNPAAYPPMAGSAALAVEVDVSVSVGPGGIGASASASLGASPHLALRPGESFALSDDEVVHFRLRSAVRSNAVLLRDYDFQRPLLDLHAEVKTTDATGATVSISTAGGLASSLGAAAASTVQAVMGAAGGLAQQLLVYEHRGDYATPEVTPARAQSVLDQLRRDATLGAGESACRRMSAGVKFTLDTEAFPALAGEYVLTHVEHEGTVPEFTAKPGSGNAPQTYRNRFECVRSEIVFRPKRPKRRFMQVMESAAVVGPKGEDIYTDEFGRIKVQFPWDLDGKNNEFSSCWMRVIHSWGGTAWGTQFIPRVGMEVMVGFLSADQDCPVVLGCVYNATHPPSFALPSDKTRSGIRTQTSGGPGFNELSFEDKRGAEEVFLHGQKDWNVLIEHDTNQRIGNDETRAVVRNRSKEVGGDQSEIVGGNKTIQVGKNHAEVIGQGEVKTVGTNRTEMVGESLSQSVGVNMSVEVGASSDLSVGTDLSVSVGRTMSVTVAGTKKEVIAQGASESSGVKSIDVSGDFSISVGGGMTTSVSGSHGENVGAVRSMSAGSLVSIQCGGGKMLIDSGGNVSIEATQMKIVASGEVQIDAGSGVKVTTAGTVQVKGGAVKIN